METKATAHASQKSAIVSRATDQLSPAELLTKSKTARDRQGAAPVRNLSRMPPPTPPVKLPLAVPAFGSPTVKEPNSQPMNTNRKKLKKPNKMPRTLAARCGLSYPVKKISSEMKSDGWHATKTAAVYLASTLEYITAELMELAGNACKDTKHKMVNVRHLSFAIRGDDELDSMLDKAHFQGAGVMPHIHHYLQTRTKALADERVRVQKKAKEKAILASVGRASAGGGKNLMRMLPVGAAASATQFPRTAGGVRYVAPHGAAIVAGSSGGKKVLMHGRGKGLVKIVPATTNEQQSTSQKPSI